MADTSSRASDNVIAEATRLLVSYMGGVKLGTDQQNIAKAMLREIPDHQAKELWTLSRRANDRGPQGAPGEMMGMDIRVFEQERKSAQADLFEKMRQSIAENPRLNQELMKLDDMGYDTMVVRRRFIGGAVDSPREEPVTLAIQQQQAYLKLLGHDIGPAGLDGIAGKGSMTQKALDEFAQKNGIDPKDTGAVNQALLSAALKGQTKSNTLASQKNIENGKASPEDIKIVQWLLKGTGAAMALSLRNGKMDGIALDETKSELKRAVDYLTKPNGADAEAGPDADGFEDRLVRRSQLAAGVPARDNLPADHPLRLFRDNLREILSPYQQPLAEFGQIVQSMKQEGYEDIMVRRKQLGGDVQMGRAFGAAAQGEPAVQDRGAGLDDVSERRVQRSFQADTGGPKF